MRIKPHPSVIAGASFLTKFCASKRARLGLASIFLFVGVIASAVAPPADNGNAGAASGAGGGAFDSSGTQVFASSSRSKIGAAHMAMGAPAPMMADAGPAAAGFGGHHDHAGPIAPELMLAKEAMAGVPPPAPQAGVLEGPVILRDASMQIESLKVPDMLRAVIGAVKKRGG